MEGVADILYKFPCTSGFSLNVGSVSYVNVLNFEVSPEGIWRTIIDGYDYHFNMLGTSGNLNLFISAVKRIKRIYNTCTEFKTFFIRILGVYTTGAVVV